MQCARRVRESWATLNALSFLLSFCSRRLWPRFSAVFRPHLSSHSPRTRAAIAKRFAQGPYCTPIDADDAQLGANPLTWKNGSIVTTTARHMTAAIAQHAQRTLHPLPRCSHSPLCPDSTTASAEKRRGRRAGSAHRAGRLSRRVMAMTIRAEIRRSVGRGDEGRRPRVAVALGLLGRPRRTGQSGRGGARGRRVTLFQRRCWFGMSAGLSWPVSAARGGSDGIGIVSAY